MPTSTTVVVDAMPNMDRPVALTSRRKISCAALNELRDATL
jgi:hypothetical protein